MHELLQWLGLGFLSGFLGTAFCQMLSIFHVFWGRCSLWWVGYCEQLSFHSYWNTQLLSHALNTNMTHYAEEEYKNDILTTSSNITGCCSVICDANFLLEHIFIRVSTIIVISNSTTIYKLMVHFSPLQAGSTGGNINTSNIHPSSLAILFNCLTVLILN